MNDSLTSDLQALSTSASSISISAKIQKNIKEIEHAIASGVSMREIVSTLNKHGIAITEKSFPMTLYRIRKREIQKSAKLNREGSKTQTPLTSEREPDDHYETSGVIQSQGPAALDAIINSSPDLNALKRAAKRFK
ncbi:hypothetical protein [Acidovorax facilis]|jgi:hypothetical protein|uniref:hypothetical protein n=1 Tax=Acidovorax facilis TaxID=12917 RepID=UPI003D651701